MAFCAIPAIDITKGSCVRLKQGLMNDSTVYSENPVEVARRWVNEKATRIHLVDLDGAFSGNQENTSVIEQMLEEFGEKISFQVGGGIRDIKTVERLFNIGATYVVIGTAAVNDPVFLERVCSKFSKKIIWDSLHNFLINTQKKVVMIGDFNTGLNEDTEGSLFKYNIKLKELLHTRFIDIWKNYNKKMEYTWYSKAGNGFRVDQVITQKESSRDLGVTMSDNCSFDTHIANSIKKSKKMISWILRTFKTRKKEHMLYVIYIYSY